MTEPMYAACAIIAARSGSKRLAHKNMRMLGGKTLIRRAVEGCREAGSCIGLIAVSTDSNAYALEARACGAKTVMRPAELASDTARIDEAAAHAVRALYPEGGYPTVTLMVQPNVPVWEPGTARAVVERMMKGDCSAVVTACKIRQRPEWAMQRGTNGFLHPYIVPLEPRPVNSQQLPQGIYFIDGQIVAVETSRLLSNYPRTYLGPCGNRIAVQEHDDIYATDIDTAADLLAAEAILASKGLE